MPVSDKLSHLRKELFHVGHFVRDILRRANAIFVSADSLRPEAKRALCGAATAGVEAYVRMKQIADEIFFNLQVAPVHIRHPRQRIHILNHLALGIVFNLPLLIAIRKAGDRIERSVFGNFLASKIEFFAPNPINRG